jgi:hypothetical protein
MQNGKYRDYNDYRSFIEFSGTNVIEKWRSARDGKYNKISPLSGTYSLSVENRVNFLDITWKNNTKEKFLVLTIRERSGFFLYNSDGKPYFIGMSCDDGEYLGDFGMEADFSMDRYTFNISGITSSSSLREGNISHTPDRINLNANEAWAEGAKGSGVGEYIIFNEKIDVIHETLFISFGYVSYSKPNLFSDNARPKKIKVSWADTNQSVIMDLYDTPNFQVIEKPKRNFDSEGFSGPIKIEILEVYPGTKYSDTCIFAAFVHFSQ